jgi:alkaline phosphatase
MHLIQVRALVAFSALSASFTLGACSFGDGETSPMRITLPDDQGVAVPANPIPRVVEPKPDGTSNLPDVPVLPPGEGRRHVIVMIGDGMHMAHEVAASRYLHDTDFGLSFHALPVRAFKTTWNVTSYNQRASALGKSSYSPEEFDPSVGYNPAIGGALPYPLLEDSEERRNYFVGAPYPDSASTATAMSTGRKALTDAIGVAPGYDGTNGLEHASALLRRFYGMALGFVTTVQFYHATPAGFFAHNSSRGSYGELAHELITQVMPEVMIGAGYGRESEFGANNVEAIQQSDKYLYVHRSDGSDGGEALLAAAAHAVQRGKRLFGLFGDPGLGNFVSPVPADNPGNPIVSRGSTLDPTLADASLAALQVLAQDPEGFFLMIEQGDIDRANHSNDFASMIGSVSDLDAAVKSVIDFVDQPHDDIDWKNTTLIVTADHANSYMRFVKRLHAGDLPAQSGSTYPDGEVTYGWGSHTSELVDVYVKGYAENKVKEYQTPYPGLEIIDDTSVYRLILDAARR